MARGLSNLQKNVLVMAYYRRQKAIAEGTYVSPEYGCDLLAAHVLIGYYGWKKSGKYRFIAKGGQNFSSETIGRNIYNNTRSILSDSFRRLQNRGLVIRSRGDKYSVWSGINLTEKGIEKVKDLLDNIKNDSELENIELYISRIS